MIWYTPIELFTPTVLQNEPGGNFFIQIRWSPSWLEL